MKHFKHDCSNCTFHGHMQGYDVYTCETSIVLRHGDDGPAYLSIPKTMLDIVSNTDGKWAATRDFISTPAMV